MMANQVAEREPVGCGQGVSPQAKVVWTHGTTLLCLNLQSVCGCTEIQRPSRLPGAQGRVSGLILFKGEPVPLVSLFADFLGRPVQRGKHEEYAIVLSVKGMRFAVRVDEVPRIISDSKLHREQSYRSCRIGTKHLERLFKLYVSPGLSCFGTNRNTVTFKESTRTRASRVPSDNNRIESNDNGDSSTRGSTGQLNEQSNVPNCCCTS